MPDVAPQPVVATLTRAAIFLVATVNSGAESEARVRALCRRRGGLRPSLERCGDLVIDRAVRAVRRDGVLLTLTPKEFALLEVLVDAGGAAVSREELIDRCWDERADMFSNAVNVHIAALRRKLGLSQT